HLRLLALGRLLGRLAAAEIVRGRDRLAREGRGQEQRERGNGDDGATSHVDQGDRGSRGGPAAGSAPPRALLLLGGGPLLLGGGPLLLGDGPLLLGDGGRLLGDGGRLLGDGGRLLGDG